MFLEAVFRGGAKFSNKIKLFLLTLKQWFKFLLISLKDWLSAVLLRTKTGFKGNKKLFRPQKLLWQRWVEALNVFATLSPFFSPEDNQPQGLCTFLHWAQNCGTPKGSTKVSFSVLSECPFAGEKSWASDAPLRQLQMLWHPAGWLFSDVWVPERPGLAGSSWNTWKSLAEHWSALAEEAEIKHQIWKCSQHWCSGTWIIYKSLETKEVLHCAIQTQ